MFMRTGRGSWRTAARPSRSASLAATTVAVSAFVIALVLGSQPATAGPATGGGADRSGLEVYTEQLLLGLHNEVRRDPSSQGLTVPPAGELIWSSELSALARDSSDRLASLGRLDHDPAINGSLCCDARVANNIGTSGSGVDDAAVLRPSAQRLLTAWLNSNDHRQHVLDDRFTHVGLGVTIGQDGRMWATAVFQARSATTVTSGTAAPGAVDISPVCPGPVDTRSERFDDVSGRHAHAIDCLVERGIVNGVGDGRFDPATTVTRAQFAMLVARVLDDLGESMPSPTNGVFTDVSARDTAADAIGQTVSAGISTGRLDGRFLPNDPVSRGQVAALLDAVV
ncbi:MAG: S-layer homology domain-containing protein, partial [Nitriliruptoraceae bacterium]